MQRTSEIDSHLGVHGAYSFLLPELPSGSIRALRYPDAPEADEAR